MIRSLTILIVLVWCGVSRGGLLTDFSASYALYQQCAMNGADFDVDDDIDGTDYLQWQRGVGMVGQFINPFGDADRNGYVNNLDMTHWKGQFGGDLTGLPESECFKLFLEPEGIISGSATLVIDVPNPNPGQPRLAFGNETRIIDVHPQYTAQVLQQTILTPLGRQRLEVRVGFTANDPTNPPSGPVTILGFQVPDLMPGLGVGGVNTAIQFRTGDTITVFDTDTGVTTTFDHNQLDDVFPTLMAPLVLDVNTTTGNARFRNPASSPVPMTILTNYYEITSLAGTLNPTGWTSLDDGEMDPPGLGWEEAGGANAFALSESNLGGVLELGNGQTRSLGHAFNELRGNRDLRLYYTTPQGALIPGVINYSATAPLGAVPEPSAFFLAMFGAFGAAGRWRRSANPVSPT